MRIRVLHTLIDEVDEIEVLRGLAEGSRLVPTMFAILATPYLCFTCELQEHADRGGAQRSGAWRIVAESAKHVRGHHSECKHAESHDAHRAGAHNANVKYKYMSRARGNSEL